MRANWHACRLTPEDSSEARKLASHAIALDPNMARPRVIFAMCNVWDVLFARSQAPQQSLAEASEMARRAVELDGRDAEAHLILGVVALFLRHFDDSLRRLETALEINRTWLRLLRGGDTTRFLVSADRPMRISKEALRLVVTRRTIGRMPLWVGRLCRRSVTGGR
jgi:hypothetical protein